MSDRIEADELERKAIRKGIMTANDIIDRALELLKDPAHWTKGAYWRTLGEKSTYCLAGALITAAKTDPAGPIDPEWSTARRNVVSALPDDISRRSLTAYNDRETTTHGDVIAVLKAARQA